MVPAHFNNTVGKKEPEETFDEQGRKWGWIDP